MKINAVPRHRNAIELRFVREITLLYKFGLDSVHNGLNKSNQLSLFIKETNTRPFLHIHQKKQKIFGQNVAG